jgi:5-hydroxyisourate hydrolase-like protein (transthyretin family)
VALAVPSQSVAGRVLAEESRAPLKGATVRISFDSPRGAMESNPWLAVTSTDENGSFEVKGLWFASYLVRASAEGRLDAERPHVLPDSPAEILLALDPGIPCRVEVDRDGGEEALPGQAVLLEMPEEGWRLETQTDAEGNFLITGIDRNKLKLAASFQGLDVVVPGFVEAELTPEKNEERYTITVQEGKTVSGQVLDQATGKPIAGATVASDSGHSALTDAEGRYAIAGVGDYMAAHARGYAAQTLDLEELQGQKEPLQHDFRLGPGLTLFGRVRDAAGAGIAGVRVGILLDSIDWDLDSERVGRALADQLSAVSDETGKYRIVGLPAQALDLPGLLDIEVRPPGSGNGIAEEVKIDIEAGEVQHDITLNLVASVPGVVLKADGAPLAGAQVYLESVQDDLYQVSATDGDGKFVLRNLAVGNYRLVVESGDRPLIFQTIAIPSESLTLRVEPSVAVQGAVVSTKDAEALPNMKVRLISGRTRFRFTLETVTDGAGGFVFTDAPTGDYQLDISLPQDSAPFRDLAPRHRINISVPRGGWSSVVQYPNVPAGMARFRFSILEKDGSKREVGESVDVRVTSFRASPRDGKRMGFSYRARDGAGTSLGTGAGTFETRLREGTYSIRCILSSAGATLTKDDTFTIAESETLDREVVFSR